MTKDEGATPSGVLAIDKPEGPTSHDVVRRVRRILGTRRVGHCGTLDPLATGLLLICVGRLTRLSDWLTGADKQYQASFRLGARSDTADAQGQITPVESPVPSASDVEQAIGRWRGVVQQVPPAHSAIKVDGVRSYDRARRQEIVDLPARTVTVKRFEVDEYDYPHVRVTVDCSKGTYIRSLARDVGEMLGCGGYVEALRRTRVGSVDVSAAVTLDEMERLAGPEAAAGKRSAIWLDPVATLSDLLPPLRIDAAGARDFTRGRAVNTSAAAGEVLVCCGPELLGVGLVEDEILRPLKVFAEPTL